MSDKFDVIVVGGGPGGYVAAIRAAQLGLRVACVDRQSNPSGASSLGGTCLNIGCIPSKALLDSSERYHALRHSFAEHGITAENARLDIAKMQARKAGIVTKLTSGIATLFKAHKIHAIHGNAQLRGSGSVLVRTADNNGLRVLEATHIILAPGSAPIQLPDIPFDHERIVDSTGALNFAQVPKTLGVIGAGVIGLELGSVWRRLGAEVTILEAETEFLASADTQIARIAARQFQQQGLDIRLGASVTRARVEGDAVAISYTQAAQQHAISVERLIVAVGRKPATAQLLGENCGVNLDLRGGIEVDAYCRTAANNVWAIGDAVRGPMLAHKASEEGVAVAERIAAGRLEVGHVDFNTVPWVIYTAPEIAWVGQTEQQLSAEKIPHRSGTFPFAATGRALAMGETAGLVKLIAHRDSDRILGVHIIGPHVSELIAECVLAMEYQASAEDLARTIHAHPTLSEAVHEAALAVDKRAIHKVG